MDEKVECQDCGWIGTQESLIEVDNANSTEDGVWECPKCGMADNFLNIEYFKNNQ